MHVYIAWSMNIFVMDTLWFQFSSRFFFALLSSHCDFWLTWICYSLTCIVTYKIQLPAYTNLTWWTPSSACTCEPVYLCVFGCCVPNVYVSICVSELNANKIQADERNARVPNWWINDSFHTKSILSDFWYGDSINIIYSLYLRYSFSVRTMYTHIHTYF